MTTAEKNQKKMQVLNECLENLRNTVRRNGGDIAADADISEVVDHVLDIDPERVKLRWLDISTIDAVKACMLPLAGLGSEAVGLTPTEEPLSLTAEELLEYGINDPRLTAGHHSWAVIKITKHGMQILTCGGNFYQMYVREFAGDGSYTMVQKGGTDILAAALSQEQAPWLAEHFVSEIRSFPVYAEGGVEYYHIPCDLPWNLGQLVSMVIPRSSVAHGKDVYPYWEQLTAGTCDTSNEGMIGLPHDIWYVYDNSSLVSAPRGLLIPKTMADGEDGYCWDTIKIVYSPIASGLERLRLVSSAFGEAYTIAIIDRDVTALGGTWNE